MRTNLVGCFVLVCLSLLPALTAQELKPQSVIIHSPYYDNVDVPIFIEHSFDLLKTTNLRELYLPPFGVSFQQFPQEPSFNISLSGLTKSFAGLSELFLGDSGKLENAYLLYLTEHYEAAEKKLTPILPSTTALGEKATLLMAWTKFKMEQPEAAMVYAKAGFQTKQDSIAKESFYLAALILYQQHAWDQIISLLKEQSVSRETSFWDARFCLIQLYALYSLERWKAAEAFVNQIEMRRFANSPLYFKFYELSGNINYQRKQYQNSIQDFQKAQMLSPDLNYRKRLNRFIVWLHYLLGHYEDSLNLINQFAQQSLIETSDEINYLKLACLIHLERWQAVSQAFVSFLPDSAFYNYAAFKIQVQSSPDKLDNDLKKRLSNVHFDFPDMVFQTALQNGNQAFKTDRFAIAENYYLSALSAEVSNSESYLAHYNLGLTHLKQQEYSKAHHDFSQLIQTIPNQKADLLYYHLLYTYYQLQQKEEFLSLYHSINLTNLNDDQAYELQVMLGNILMSVDRNKEAREIFFRLWKEKGQSKAFESAIAVLFKEKNYNSLLQSLQDNPKPTSELLFNYEIRTLLATQKEKLALARLEKATFQSERFFELQLEVWLANQLYQKIIDQITIRLNRSLPNESRLLYYLHLGDAHFNLKQYGESKNQFYKALELTEDPVQKSTIQYNIALTTYYLNDFPTFVQEANVVLAGQQAIPEIRYNLTQLLVDYYQTSHLPNEADNTLATYLDKNTFQRVKAKLKRIQLLYQNREYQKCFELGSVFDSSEDFCQYRDRLILMGYCGAFDHQETLLIPILKKELESMKQPYRNTDLQYVLALAHFNQEEYEISVRYLQQINLDEPKTDFDIKARLLFVKNLLKLGKPIEADQKLGDLDQYRQGEYYVEALNLHAELEVTQGTVDDSVKALLRVYYLPSSSEDEKQLSLLRAGEILAANQRNMEARGYLEKIDGKWASGQEPVYKRFLHLKEILNLSAD